MSSMPTQPASNGDKKTPSGKKTRTARRSPGACMWCRHRKIRCDASIYGLPCTNCRLDERSCSVQPHLNQPLAMRSSPETLPRIFDGSCAPKPQPFYRYRFLTAPGLGNLQSQDLLCLKWQNCLQVPDNQILDGLVRHYFRHVHPCLPMIDEGYFWRMYNNANVSSPDQTISLLVFQAMLFAAASYIPLELAKSLGHESVRAARDSLYRRAKALFDSGIEKNSLSLAQAALLLTYYHSNDEQLTNSSWLGIAIHHAQSIDAHLYDRKMRTTLHKKSDLKRLWWSCIVRDRVIAIALRRPIQITEYHFDFSQEAMLLVDLEEEIHHSCVYDAETKRHLAVIHTVQCQLAVVMTDIIPVLYPATGIKIPSSDVLVELSKCMDIRNSLNAWKECYFQQIEGDGLDVHPSVSIHAHVTTLYYHSVRIALCHRVAFLLYVYKKSWRENQIFSLTELKHELTDAVKTVTEKVTEFILNGFAGHLPLAVLVNALLPNILLRLDLQLPSLSAQDQSRDRRALWYYSMMTKVCTERFDTSYLADCNDRLCRMFEIAEMSNFQGNLSLKSHTDILEYQPSLYLRLAMTLDSFLASGMESESWSTNHMRPEFELGIGDVGDARNSVQSISLEGECPSIISGQMYDDPGLLGSFGDIATDIQQGGSLNEGPTLDLDQIFTHLPLFGE